MNTPFARVMSGVVVGVALSVSAIVAQTVITAPNNRYTPAEDVELGRQAAAQAEQQLPILRDEAATSYLASLGRRLVEAIPPELGHPEFRYSFKLVNLREINAFALPGGPTYFNRGMIEVAHTEGEVASVIAHELSHVALRHGTAQATKATKYEIGTLLGAVVGSIVGGRVGSAVAQGTQFGLGTAFLRFSREFERQADLLGSHIMARAGYDPRDMASMFKTIEKQGGGGGGPQWLSDHPNPGDRYEYITREAKTLAVQNPRRDTRAFAQVQARLRGMPPAQTTEQARNATVGTTGRAPGTGTTVGRPESVAPPSSSYTTYTEGNLFRVAVPSNWRERPQSHAVTFAPDGAYGNAGGQDVFTHGVQIGVARNETHDLRTATDELVASLAGGNPSLSRPSAYTRARIGGRQGLRTVLSNVSDATGQQERIEVSTMLMRDGNLFFALAVAPRDSFRDYETAFRRVMGSIQMLDERSVIR